MSLLDRRGRHAARGDHPGAPGHARLADGGAERPGDRARRERRRRFVTGSRSLLSVGGIVAICVGLFGGIESSSDAAALLGAGRRAALLRHGAAVAAAVAPLASVVGIRWSACAADGPAGARERGAQPGPDGHHRRRADDRPRAGHVRHRVRRAASKASIDDAIDQSFTGDLTAAAQGRLLADPGGGARRRSSKSTASDAVSSLRFGDGDVEETGDTSFITAIDPARGAAGCSSSTGRRARTRRVAAMTRDDAIVDQAWATDNDIEVGDTLDGHDPDGPRGDLHGRAASSRTRPTSSATSSFTHRRSRRTSTCARTSMVLVNYSAGADADAVREDDRGDPRPRRSRSSRCSTRRS